MNFIKTFFCLIFFFISVTLVAQVGGRNTYEFVNLPNSARVSSLGGNNLTIYDSDLSMAYYNPALLNSSMSENISMNYSLFMAGINYGYLSYAKEVPKYGTFAVGLQYINYGRFTEADETGEITGNFYAQESNLNLIWAKPVLDSMFTFGANLKTIYSEMYHYYSSALLLDAGLTYHNKIGLFEAAVVLKNMGVQLKTYNKGYKEPLPFDIQAGITKKLHHAPLRLSFVFDNTLTPNMTYVVSSTDTGSVIKKGKFLTISDKILRHFVLGIEIIPTKNIYFNLGYNYQRRQELMVETRPHLTGLTWGFGFKISKFRFSYGRARYHLASATSNISISVNLAEFYKKSNPN